MFREHRKDINGQKVVTLNGRPMWKGESTPSSIAERIEQIHMIFELPNGKFTVASQKFINDYITIKKIIIIDNKQITWYPPSSNSSDLTL